jgi:hypothetical protein
VLIAGVAAGVVSGVTAGVAAAGALVVLVLALGDVVLAGVL